MRMELVALHIIITIYYDILEDMSTDCYYDILQNYSIHYSMFIIADPLSSNVSSTGTFVFSMLCIECTYVPVLFCISSSISTVPNSDGKIRVPPSTSRSGRRFPRRLSDLPKILSHDWLIGF